MSGKKKLTFINTFLIFVKIGEKYTFCTNTYVIYGYISPLLVIIFGAYLLCIAET